MLYLQYANITYYVILTYPFYCVQALGKAINFTVNRDHKVSKHLRVVSYCTYVHLQIF